MKIIKTGGIFARPKSKKKGFTLTEVLVVVLIIGVITAIAYPMYTKTINKSRAVEAINLIEMVRNKQVANMARHGEYVESFRNMGRIVADEEAQEFKDEGAILKVGKYELAMNTTTNCMTASYVPAEGKPAAFTFSSRYDKSGLGCDGDICSTFGNIIGTSGDICNCGGKSCDGNLTIDNKTCQCKCNLSCDGGRVLDATSCSCSCTGDKVWNGSACVQNCNKECPSGPTVENGSNCGSRSRTCDKCTGNWNSWGPWSGTKTDTKPCGSGFSGTMTRTCSNNAWGEFDTSGCVGTLKECDWANKPDIEQPCPNCGVRRQTLECNKQTGQWIPSGFGTCVGTKTQSKDCPSGYTGTQTNTCTDDVWAGWDTSRCIKTAVKQCNGSTTEYRDCGNCGTERGTRRCDTTTGTWLRTIWSGNCTGEGVCKPGATAICSTGSNPFGTKKCSSSCKWGSCIGSPTQPGGGACKISSCPSGTYMVNAGTSNCCCENRYCGITPPNGGTSIGYCQCIRTDYNAGGSTGGGSTGGGGTTLPGFGGSTGGGSTGGGGTTLPGFGGGSSGGGGTTLPGFGGGGSSGGGFGGPSGGRW